MTSGVNMETKILNLDWQPTKDRHIELRITVNYDAQKLVELCTMDNLMLNISKERKKRSNNANSYYQELLDQLKDVLRRDRDELHFDLLRRYGQTAVDSEGNKLIFSIISQIDGTKISKYVEVIGHGEVGGKDFTHYRVLKGSSEMDSREFSILLEGLIDECRIQGISTMTPAELEKLKGYTK